MIQNLPENDFTELWLNPIIESSILKFSAIKTKPQQKNWGLSTLWGSLGCLFFFCSIPLKRSILEDANPSPFIRNLPSLAYAWVRQAACPVKSVFEVIHTSIQLPHKASCFAALLCASQSVSSLWMTLIYLIQRNLQLAGKTPKINYYH